MSDPYTVAVALATGTVAIAAVWGVGAVIGLGIYAARCVGHHRQGKAREATRGMP